MPSLACFADGELAQGVGAEIEAVADEEAVIVDQILQMCCFSACCCEFRCLGCVALCWNLRPGWRF